MRLKLAALFIAILSITAILFIMRDSFTLHPFQTEEKYTAISRMTEDESGSVYTITDSKRTINKVNKDGVLIYSLSSKELKQSDNVQLFDSVAADAAGNAYVLMTILDAYGLKVLSEQIIQLSSDGSRTRVMYEANYTESDNLLRVGNIQSLSVDGEELYFFVKEDDSASLMKLSLQMNAAEPLLESSIELPKGNYLNELARTQNGELFVSTKRGLLFSVKEGEATRLYPPENDNQLHFPVSIVPDTASLVYFIDNYDNAIKVVNTSDANISEKVIATMDQLTDKYPDSDWSEFTNISIIKDHILISASEQLVTLSSDGSIVDIKQSYRYTNMIIAKRIGYWVLLFLLLAIVAYTVRMIYVDVLNRKIFLLLKQLAVILPVVLLSMTGLSYSIYSSFAAEMRDDTYKQLRMLAANGKYLVDGEHLERLNSPLDYRSDDYLIIKERVSEVFSRAGEDRDGLYNTIYKLMDGKLYIVMDDDDSVTMFKPFLINEENQLVLEQGEIVLGEWKDASGEWIYALGPLFNENGEIIGIYETGKDMIGVKQSNMIIFNDVVKIVVLIGLVLLVVITMMTTYLLSSIRKLRRNVNLIASGEWDVKVDIRTRDEVEELGDRFNMMAGSIHQYIQEVTKLSNAYFRFVPQQFLKVLGKTNMTQVKLGEQQNRSMTILVCNMRGFNEMSAVLSTEANFQFINSFLKQFGPVIREHGGFTSRYLGPGMLTMFPNEASASLKAAMRLRMTLESYNADRERHQLAPVDIGIAVHSGDVMLGIIGEEQRMEGSVVSNHVQLTLDLEKLSAKLGVNILLTEHTLRMLGRSATEACRNLGMLQIDRDHEPVQLYDWYEGDPEHIQKLKDETKKQFEAAVEAFRNGRFYDAREGFVSVVKKNRYDLAAKLYFFECDRCFQEGVAKDWNHSLYIA